MSSSLNWEALSTDYVAGLGQPLAEWHQLVQFGRDLVAFSLLLGFFNLPALHWTRLHHRQPGAI